MSRRSIFVAVCCFAAAAAAAQPPRPSPKGDGAPKAHDPRLVVTRFAAAPDVVHPVAIDFDHKGRLLVIESHTHFPPKGYKGPKHDRILALEDTDNDGKADRFTVFFEGSRDTMDLAIHPGGSVYVATRNEIFRLRDTDGDGKADERRRLVYLATAGDYPHNGLSGLCFDSKGDLYFGMGENLGVGYKLTGADGATVADEGEGGNVFHCTADGKKLRRVATGFWNPFGVCRDVFGRRFAVDNDPDASPPCRLVHVVDGGDYGFQFRYGRSGRHPFQSWHGELYGTLPMMSGTGEGPCEVLAYESDGLPREYVGDLLVTAWADHRIERYTVTPSGSSFKAERKPFVQGGADFRPVGLAVAPDGSLFASDWVLPDYTLHGKGAIWHIRWRDAKKPERPTDPRKGLFSAHRPLREASARALAKDAEGRLFLFRQLGEADVRVRAASLAALDGWVPRVKLQGLARKDPSEGIRAMAVRALAGRGETVRDTERTAEMQRESVAAMSGADDVATLLGLLRSDDPFLRTAAIRQFASHPKLLAGIDVTKQADPRTRAGLLLAHRGTGRQEARALAGKLLGDADDTVRLLAIKWIADEKLSEHRAAVAKAMKGHTRDVREFHALATALARIDGAEVHEARLADYFFERAADATAPPSQRAQALRLVPASHRKLTVELLGRLLASSDGELQLEAARALSEHASPKRAAVLLDAARNAKLPAAVRAQAVVGLAEQADGFVDDLLKLAAEPSLRDEALRALTGVKLTAAQRGRVEEMARAHPGSAALAERALGKPAAEKRPPADDLAGWLARLRGPADAEAGRRVFFHPRLANCYRCHRVEGRGRDLGPDLSGAGRIERGRLLESILRPGASVAPHYQAWQFQTDDGQVRTGMLVKTYLDESSYLDSDGKVFKVNTATVTASRPSPQSIMPAGLADRLTDQELRDLLAYLAERR